MSDDDAYGPALPPGLVRNPAGPTRPTEPFADQLSPNPSRVGPPPSDSDSDDEIGPHLPAAPSSHSAADTFREREARIARARAAADVPKKPQRDEWMTLGPPSGLSHIDALKRPTQFQKNSREAAPVDQGWLETPAERAARERDEADGAHPPPLKRKAQGTEGQRERDEEMRRRIEAHSKSRGASLLQKHRENRKEASPPPIWDRETMMGVGSALSGEERVKKIREAADLGDRFGHGRSGAYM
ncbi:hypothetical protein CspeluHIS016_0305050 [Cutaneotrichosporon spelunceum]|uniref:DUF3752 domain-containing protein n=1 Tax=Cutaneotrichosporon spelunceum TaxID=1672016 RepID=A0AAD3TUG2_9TREE|nr:hypothetical protein CspeluHIS016_0305050 [Cutaneotrichosporon spelunceum]